MLKVRFPKLVILIAVAILPCFLNKTFALATDDCDTISGDIKLFGDYSLDGKLLKFSNVFPKEALDMAIKNLTSYCCKHILNKGTMQDPRCKDTINLTDNYPESPYLFDQLIDVGLRRLDAINTYGLTPDPTGVARRTFIRGVATNPDTTVPTKITDAYTNYRSLHTDRMLRQLHLKIKNMNTNDVGTLHNFLEQYNEGTVSLADKYNNLCRIAWNIYEKNPGEKVIIGADSLSKGRSYYTDCQKMVARRMNQENLYVKGILIDKANKMLQDNLTATLIKQFAQDKLSALQSVISSIKNLLQTIVNKAPYCKKCSQ